MVPLKSDRLDAGQIRSGLATEAKQNLRQLTLLQDVDSTNTAILRLPGEQQHAHVILAERQTGGRGRRERSWHSPAGGNIYLSLGWWFMQNKWPLSTLPLVVAIAVCRALSRAGLKGHGIKWPNDILVDNKKLAGILVELQSAGRGPAVAVIGVGLNVRMPSEAPGDIEGAIDRPWTDLASQLGPENGGISRNELVVLLLEELLTGLELFETMGFEAFRTSWQSLDLLNTREIQLEQKGQNSAGVARGVDKNGSLLLETPDSGVVAYYSGEVSIHRD